MRTLLPLFFGIFLLIGSLVLLDRGDRLILRAHLGNPQAMHELGIEYQKLSNACVHRDIYKSIYWLERAGDAGDLDAYYDLGLMRYITPQGPMHWFLLGAEKGHRGCMLEAYKAYQYAIYAGYPHDQAKADYWMGKLRALESWDETVHQRSPIEFDGPRPALRERDRLEAKAKAGDPQAMYEYARCLEQNFRTSDQDWKDAMDWYERAAQHGQLRAMVYLYKRYNFQFPGKAMDGFHWLEKAASAGDPDAEIEMWLVYHDGETSRFGLKPDPVQEKIWREKIDARHRAR